jgi:hypothetical protein
MGLNLGWEIDMLFVCWALILPRTPFNSTVPIILARPFTRNAWSDANDALAIVEAARRG